MYADPLSLFMFDQNCSSSLKTNSAEMVIERQNSGSYPEVCSAVADGFDTKMKREVPQPKRVDRGSYQVIVRSQHRDVRRMNNQQMGVKA